IVVVVPVVGNAGSLFLNGVNIDGVTNQVFNQCKVEIDAYGNVHITAKGYAVHGRGGAAPQTTPNVPLPAVAGPPSRRYWLVTEKAAPGMTQYDIDLFINSKWVRKFLDREEHVVLEITKYLRTGPNKVQFVAKKNVGTARRSASPQHYFRIIIGEGNTGGRNIMISKKAVDYKRTALETKNYSDAFTLIAQ
ncbi:MAG: hypothetical protein V3T05_09770, partial [Myxococcota bacterium]